MNDMFNQSTPSDGAERPQEHTHRPPPREATALPEHRSTPLTDTRPSAADGRTPAPAPPQLQPSAGSITSEPQRGTPPSEMDTVDELVPPVMPATSYTIFGIEIRPDTPPAEIDRLASKLGRPKANAAAEELIQKWAAFIGQLRDNRVPFEKVLDVMFAGPDKIEFKKEFLDGGKVTEKSMRKFRTLVGAARQGASSVERSRADVA